MTYLIFLTTDTPLLRRGVGVTLFLLYPPTFPQPHLLFTDVVYVFHLRVNMLRFFLRLGINRRWCV